MTHLMTDGLCVPLSLSLTHIHSSDDQFDLYASCSALISPPPDLLLTLAGERETVMKCYSYSMSQLCGS